MQKDVFILLALPLFYISSVVLMEFFPNIFTILLWVISILLCLFGLFGLFKLKANLSLKVLLVFLLLTPILDLSFGFTKLIRDSIKGDIVLSIMDDGPIHSRTIVVRDKDGELNAEYDFSAAGFGQPEKANVSITSDSTFVLNLIKRNYSINLTYDQANNRFINTNENHYYRILSNHLFN